MSNLSAGAFAMRPADSVMLSPADENTPDKKRQSRQEIRSTCREKRKKQSPQEISCGPWQYLDAFSPGGGKF